MNVSVEVEPLQRTGSFGETAVRVGLSGRGDVGRVRRGAVAPALLAFALLAAPSVVAATDVGKVKAAGGDAAPAASGQAVSSLQGFRSARFGMTQAEVRKAIESDFHVASKSIKAGENKAERTDLVTVGVSDLIPGGGRAVASYVFGYKSKRLIQVGITWSKATDPSLTPKTLVSNGKLLQEYFIKEHFSPGTVQTDRPVKNGLLLFRGTDAKGREAVLLMLGGMKKGGDGKRILTPTTLALLYVADPKHPDIFRLAKGQF